MNFHEPYVRGRPIPVDFMGFRSDTLQLQQSGWQIAEEWDRDLYWPTLRIAIRHPHHHMSGISDAIGRGEIMTRQTGYRATNRIEITLQIRIAIQYRIEERSFDHSKFMAVDASPQYIESPTMADIYDAPYFQPIEEGKDIFLRRASVEEIMQIALDKQAPEQAEIRARQRSQADREEFRRSGETKARLIMVA